MGGSQGERVEKKAAVVAAVEVVTLRDYFALHAPFWRLLVPPTAATEIEILAQQAYAYADSMLRVREEKKA